MCQKVFLDFANNAIFAYLTCFAYFALLHILHFFKIFKFACFVYFPNYASVSQFDEVSHCARVASFNFNKISETSSSLVPQPTC